jgi:CHAT domain-containing protein
VLEIEKKITDTWHKLLIRNAGYAREAYLWQVRVESAQPYLRQGTLLVEYYYARGQGYAFLVTRDQVEARRLPGNPAEIQHLLGRLWLNWKAVSRQGADPPGALRRNADGILRQLYRMVLEPLEETITAHSRLVVVPHGPLHYLPFHALFDGEGYLIGRHEVSYLPAGSFLRYCSEAKPAEERPADVDFMIVGNSYGGRLSYTLQEAQAVARLWGKTPLIEEEATLDRVQREAPGCRGIHLAAHGSFRADNPLFSGLALADGWLTTLDIFNLRLRASLITLSACETGRSVVKGGDELLGLMRAFLYAGAASLVLSQWAVDDRSTALLMELFYMGLVDGNPKGKALRSAQLALIQGETQAGGSISDGYAHPYYWAPFFLAGDTGPF